jgi:hypothetical protein
MKNQHLITHKESHFQNEEGEYIHRNETLLLPLSPAYIVEWLINNPSASRKLSLNSIRKWRRHHKVTANLKEIVHSYLTDIRIMRRREGKAKKKPLNTITPIFTDSGLFCIENKPNGDHLSPQKKPLNFGSKFDIIASIENYLTEQNLNFILPIDFNVSFQKKKIPRIAIIKTCYGLFWVNVRKKTFISLQNNNQQTETELITETEKYITAYFHKKVIQNNLYFPETATTEKELFLNKSWLIDIWKAINNIP